MLSVVHLFTLNQAYINTVRQFQHRSVFIPAESFSSAFYKIRVNFESRVVIFYN